VRKLGSKDKRKQQIKAFERRVMRKIHGLGKNQEGIGEEEEMRK
jgi:hypothetical protein